MLSDRNKDLAGNTNAHANGWASIVALATNALKLQKKLKVSSKYGFELKKGVCT
jgi:hypothetical protein